MIQTIQSLNYALKVWNSKVKGKGQKTEALQLFQQAWDRASNDVEKFIAAHYVARHQESVQDKLKWDEIALNLALQVNDD